MAMATAGKLVIVDLMPILYRGHFVFLSRPRRTATGLVTSCVSLFASTLEQILRDYAPTHLAIAMECDGPTFRHKLYEPYKAQREKMPEDIAAGIGHATELAEALGIPVIRAEGYEADDVLGTLATRGAAEGFEVLISSPDKDLGQLVGPHIRLLRTGEDKPWDEEAVKAHWQIPSPTALIDYLALAGDASDNIPGVAGVGGKTAAKLVQTYGDTENLIAHGDELKGKLGENVRSSTETIRLCKQLVTIVRDVPLACVWDDLRVVKPDAERVLPVLRKYELNRMAKRLGLDINAHPAEPVQGDLFAAAEAKPASAPTAEPAAEPEKPLDTLATFPHSYTLVTDETGRQALAQRLLGAALVAVDTETTGLGPRHDRVVGISFAADVGEAWYVPLPEDPAEARAAVAPFLPLFASETVAKVGHNLKFDRTALAKYGAVFGGIQHDTLLAHYLLDATARHDMDHVSEALLRYTPIPISKLIGNGREINMGDLPPEAIGDYAAEDADVTFRLWQALEPTLRKTPDLHALLTDCEEPLAGVLERMEAVGVRLDTGALRVCRTELEREILQLEIAIRDITGAGINLASPKQLGEFLFGTLQLDPSVKRSARGQFPTNEETLMKVRDRHPIVDMILDWRACVKLKNTYIDKLPEHIDPEDGRIHTTFNQSLTDTGRLSSSNPNLQNIPVRSDRGQRIRAAFVSRGPGWKVLSADYSQVELRLMAAASGDESMIRAFRNGEDIHAQTASAVYGVPIEEVTPQQRSRCKMVNFGIIYGISAFGLASRLRIPRKDAQSLITTYFEHYPAVRAYMDRTIAEARERGYAKTLFGRRRPLPDLSSRNASTRAAAERIAINMPIQGTAADIIKMAMVRIDRELRARGLKAAMTLQIHDELLFDVPDEELDTVTALVRGAMEGVTQLSVPLEVSVGVGDNWLAAH